MHRLNWRFLACLGVALSAGMLGASEPTVENLIADAEKLVTAHRYADAQRAWEALRGRVTGEQALRVQHQLGYALQRQYKNDEAIQAYRELLAMPDVPPRLAAVALVGIGECQQLSRRFEEALESFAKVEQLPGAPSDTRAGARMRSASALSKLQRFDEAVAMLESVTELEVDNPVTHQQALFHAGALRQDHQRYAEALPYYERALKIADNGTIANFVRNGLIECRTALEADPSFFFSPYVSLVSPTEATVFWVSLGSAPPQGRLTLTGGGKTMQAQATAVKVADRNAWRQTVQLTGLEPYTLYEYTAHCDGHAAVGSFHTARDTEGPIRFVVMGDTQTGWEIHQQLGPMIAAENPDFVIHVGDCVDNGPSWDQWKVQMFDPGKPYLSKAPIWVARGNHDGGPYFPILMGREKNPFISFTFGNLHVMVLESTFLMGVTSGRQQLAWLEEQFQSSTSRWTLAAMHHSLFHTANGDTLVGQENFRPLVEKYRPDLVMNGHYHKYSRQLPIGPAGQKPLVNIVTGGAGGGNSTPSTVSPIVEHSYESFHYCVFTIEGDRLDMVAKDLQGQVIDTMTLIKDANGNFQPEVMARAITPEAARRLRMVYNDLKHPHYNRRDLTGVFSAHDRAGRVTLDRNILDTRTLPEGTRLIIEAAPDCAWTVARQSLDLSAGELTFDAVPPTDADPARLTPLVVVLHVELDGRLYMPWTFPVTLRPDAVVTQQAQGK